MTLAVGCILVRSTNKVFAPIGAERLVSKQEAAVLTTMGNAEIVRDETPKEPAKQPEPKAEEPKPVEEKGGTYGRRDMTAEDPRGPARKPRQ